MTAWFKRKKQGIYTETKDKKERKRNVKSVFTTKGSRDDDYDIDMVLRKLGETTVNSSKKKSEKK